MFSKNELKPLLYFYVEHCVPLNAITYWIRILYPVAFSQELINKVPWGEEEGLHSRHENLPPLTWLALNVSLTARQPELKSVLLILRVSLFLDFSE